MKIIFLDVDGVLNSRRNVVAFGGFPWPNEPDIIEGETNPYAESNLDPIALGMIRTLCRETGANIVLHSTWRSDVDPVIWGKKYNLPIIAGTDKRIGKPASISDWLSNTNRNVDAISDYIIIDDDDMHDPGRQITTTVTNGFLYEHYSKALAMLGQANEI